MKVEELDLLVQQLHDVGAKHRRKGFRLNEASLDTMGMHLVDELAELRKAETHNDRVDEAGDVLGVVLHLFYALGLPLSDVAAAAESKLYLRFSTE